MPNGGVLFAGYGNGPKKGAPNAGRPPNEFKRALQELVDRPSVLGHIERILEAGPPRIETEEIEKPGPTPESPLIKETVEVVKGSRQFAWAWDSLADRGYGRATQPIEHSGAVALLTDEERKARLAALLGKANGTD